MRFRSVGQSLTRCHPSEDLLSLNGCKPNIGFRCEGRTDNCHHLQPISKLKFVGNGIWDVEVFLARHSFDLDCSVLKPLHREALFDKLRRGAFRQVFETKQYDAGNLDLRLSETGVEAFAAAGPRVGSFYNQAVEEVASVRNDLGNRIASTVRVASLSRLGFPMLGFRGHT